MPRTDLMNMKERFLPIFLACALSGCGGSSGGSASNQAVVIPGGGTTLARACDPNGAAAPPAPPAGQTQAGLSCAIYIASPLNPAEQIAFQLIEPESITGGETYPIILEGHGFSGSRQTSAGDSGVPGISSPIGLLHRNGYGLVSIDQAGHGETGGLIKLMDPDQEGQFLIAVLDWIDANVSWAAQGPDADAGTNNILLGAVGPSYGGGFQLLLHAVDPKKRLDAIVPEITWNNLNYSLNPGNVIKGAWDTFLFTAGNSAGGGGNFDPFVTNTFTAGLATNRIPQDGQDYLQYHGLGYFCEGQAIATNGGPGTSPQTPPNAPTQIDALFFQGFRDVLFNFNEAWDNYNCLKGADGDVRLLTYQSGHNTIPVVADLALSQPPNNSIIQSCGDIDAAAATLAWFDEKLKGVAGAADAVLDGRELCLSLSGTDAIFPDKIVTGTDGSSFAVPATPVIVGLDLVQNVVPLFTAGAQGDVFGGIPRLSINVSDTLLSATPPENTIIFVAVGHQPASQPGIWEIMDNQVLPLRGLGQFDVDMIGVAERLEPGDQVGLIFYGAYSPQFTTTGSRPTQPFAPLVNVSGTVWLPLLGPQP